jgi:hypothetical protein
MATQEQAVMNAYHTTTEHGDRVVVVCPGGETDPLHPDDAESWAREILRAVNRARDVADEGAPTYDDPCPDCGAAAHRKCRPSCPATTSHS